MSKELTVKECKSKLFKLGLKFGVSPKLISERLLSPDDKRDMLNGLLTDEHLECHVKVWIEGGMCNLADGSRRPYKPPEGKSMARYRGNGVR